MLSEYFYNVYKNVNLMLYNRGYIKSDNAELPYDIFKNMTREQLTIKTISRPASRIKQDPIYVFFPDDEKVGVKLIRIYETEMTENKINRAIIVVKNGVTSYVKSNIQKVMTNSSLVEIFNENELIIDKIQHELVPKHVLLTDEEKHDFLKKNNFREVDIPKILSSDPISRYYCPKKHDIFKIVRYSETAGFYEYYRIVV